MVVGELRMGDFIGPGTRVGSVEDLKVHFNFLVDMFCLAIRLRVVGGGKGEVIVQEFSKLLSKGGGKLWTAIRDDLVV